MATMGKHCKAYSLKKLRQFSQWTERAENSRKKQIDAKEVEINQKLTDDDFLYLQANYVVTDKVFQDENIIFDNVTPEWQEFCKNTLLFDIPSDEPVQIKVSAG
ncbi:MAG: hypothetical protein V7K18_06470 [Nostoc sp.]|uniref:hypothetical protein n=1 Tax=Nostoc sp. TaxID=1180 RepID=UPI002FF8CB45